MPIYIKLFSVNFLNQKYKYQLKRITVLLLISTTFSFLMHVPKWDQ